MKRLAIAAVVLLVTVSASAATSLYGKYEAVRQALLAESLTRVTTSAKALADAAAAEKHADVAKSALALSRAKNLDDARGEFGAVSTAMIAMRAQSKAGAPAVYYCPMAKQSWLQAKGTIGNPYEPAMPECGTLKDE
ncbi:MAG TPA: hypothetical protein VF824_07930 [Thermoanaerobaculia bacterium]|jgi:hypothetical protein